MSGALTQFTRAVTQGAQTVNAVAGVAGAVGSLVSGNPSGQYGFALASLGVWAAGMQVASWRGLPFAVHESVIRKGRRTAVHIYPYRDQIWVEDLGRGVRQYGFHGFLVGDDVLVQSAAMQDAVERPGPGTLVHPALGSLTCSVIDFAVRQTEEGRVVELEFRFLETAAVLYPGIVQSTQNAVKTQATTTFGKIAQDFQNDIVEPLQHGAQVVEGAVQTVTPFVQTAVSLAGDASLVARSVSGLVGNYGRYNSAGMTFLQSTTADVSTLLAAVTTARSVVSGAAGAAKTLAGLL